ncbi:hypothetical protein APA_4645 [Pseudanabaena sp. lw0831]|uniref:hypothetical protein n=1 Tax=Pseudanabaena sp. lw0831 TaxID=1357935 RepID=UPI001916B9A9|nr:hypothetical protein [Pseudanabaena sp. lw0831]GBO56315.1 hypothetical protein APA_4645 [Pseudanabaena sp. lw0831]
MFAQFRSQYPQGRIQTEMLPKIDGLHAFRAIVSEGDAIMGTATAVDSDLEIAEDRAVKRALAIAGLAFDNSFDHNYGNYGGRSPMLTQVSRESSINSLPSANFNALGAVGSGQLTEHNDSLPLTHTTQTIQAESAIDYAIEYGGNDHLPETEVELSSLSHPTEITAPSKSSAPQISPEPVDLSDAISKIDVEMERLRWTKTQGRDYLVRTFDKKSRQQLTNDELLQFLSHLKSLPTPHRQSANDDFF